RQQRACRGVVADMSRGLSPTIVSKEVTNLATSELGEAPMEKGYQARVRAKGAEVLVVKSVQAESLQSGSSALVTNLATSSLSDNCTVDEERENEAWRKRNDQKA